VNPRFSIELKGEVRALLNSDPNGRYADPWVWGKAAVLIALTALGYGSLLFLDQTFSGRLALVLALALLTLFLGLNVMHEAAHGNLSPHPGINRILAYTFDLFGISSDLYVIKHTHFHHHYTNLHEFDGDINEAPLIRMSLEQPRWGIHRYQALYTPLLYSLITLTWPFFDLIRLVRPRVGGKPFTPPRFGVKLRILLFKVLHYVLALALPAHLIGWKETLVLFTLFHAVLGTILALIFQVAHVHESGLVQPGTGREDWHIHQMLTSADFSTGNPWINHSFGGLNFQTIHHLFPNVSHRHFPAIRQIVIRLAKQHGIPYTHFASFGEAIRAHFRLLSRLGRA
jgi:linoleoyl-CoA desaturase